MLLSIIAPSAAVFAQEAEEVVEGEAVEEVIEKPVQEVGIGVLAKRGVEQAHEQWDATADYLDEYVNQHIDEHDYYYDFSIIPLDFNEIEGAVENEEIDFVLANSAIYVTLEVLYGANRIATMINTEAGATFSEFGGVIFHRADQENSDILTCPEEIAFGAVDETSFGGYLMALYELEEYEVCLAGDTASIEFLGTHDAVVYGVLDGTVDVGTVRTDTLERMSAEGLIDLNDIKVIDHEALSPGTHFAHYGTFPLLHSTRIYPEWPMAKLIHTDDSLGNHVAAALLDLSADNQASIDAQIVGWTTPLNYQPVHDLLRALQMRPYEDYGKVTFWEFVQEQRLLFTILGIALILIILLAIGGIVISLRFRAARNDLENLFENSVDGIVQIDGKGKVLKVNRAFSELLGYDKKVLRKMNIAQFHRPEDVEKAMEGFQLALQGKLDRLLLNMLRADKKTVPVEIKASSVSPNLVIAFVRDITERQESQSALEQRAQELERMNQLMIGRELKMKELKQSVDK